MSVMMMGSAPAAAVHKRVMRPMGPAPQMRTGSPSLTPARSTPAKATLKGSSRAPFSKLMSPILWHQMAGWLTYRLRSPSTGGVDKKRMFKQPL